MTTVCGVPGVRQVTTSYSARCRGTSLRGVPRRPQLSELAEDTVRLNFSWTTLQQRESHSGRVFGEGAGETGDVVDAPRDVAGRRGGGVQGYARWRRAGVRDGGGVERDRRCSTPGGAPGRGIRRVAGRIRASVGEHTAGSQSHNDCRAACANRMCLCLPYPDGCASTARSIDARYRRLPRLRRFPRGDEPSTRRIEFPSSLTRRHPFVHPVAPFASSYATRTIPHVGAALAALGTHPAKRLRNPPSFATATNSDHTPRPAAPPLSALVTPTPPAKSPGMFRICTRVLTTSSGVVAAATAPPATTPEKKFTARRSLASSRAAEDAFAHSAPPSAPPGAAPRPERTIRDSLAEVFETRTSAWRGRPWRAWAALVHRARPRRAPRGGARRLDVHIGTPSAPFAVPRGGRQSIQTDPARAASNGLRPRAHEVRGAAAGDSSRAASRPRLAPPPPAASDRTTAPLARRGAMS